MGRLSPWRAGVATAGPTRASEPQIWAWFVGWCALGLGSNVAEIGSSAWVAGGMALGFAGGVAWQRLYRRDLAERLFLYAWVIVLCALVLLLPGADPKTDDYPMPAVMLAQIAGLVLGEQWLRHQDRRLELA